MRIGVADQDVERQPLEELQPGSGRNAAHRAQLTQALDAARVVLGRSIKIEDLAGVQAVKPCPPGSSESPIESLDQVDRHGNVFSGHGRNRQAHFPGERHHEPLIDHRMGKVLARVIRLEDVRRGLVTAWFPKLITLKTECDFVLRSGQRHSLQGLLGQRDLGHFPYTLGHGIKRERSQLALLRYLVRRQQGDRPGRLGTKVLQHPKCVLNTNAGT
ncbi:hypothetical protein D9M68_655290 [compost metagenome]